jgi:amino acid adenylation domain-containing protein
LEPERLYWRKVLADALPTLKLEGDELRAPVQRRETARIAATIPASTSGALHALARNEGTSLWLTLLAALCSLLHRLSDRDELLVGTREAGRGWVRDEPGRDHGLLPIPTDLSGDPSFRELLGRVRQAFREAREHGAASVERLAEQAVSGRDSGRPPIFDAAVEFESCAGERPLTGADALDRDDPPLPATVAALEVRIRDRGDEIDLSVVHPPHRFQAERMQEFVLQLHQLLEGIVAAPGSRVASHSLVTRRARARLPDPRATLERPHLAPVPELFAARAAWEPRATALSHGKRRWSYRTLDRRASALATALRARGLEKGEVVAVCGVRSPGLVATAIAVLRAGGVLLLLDPDLPPRRRARMLRESRTVMLVDLCARAARQEDGVPVRHVMRVHARLGLECDVRAASRSPGLPAIAPEDPAYVFFTSREAESSKAVLGTHEGLAHFVTWQRRAFQIGARDRGAQLSTLSSDAVLHDLFTPLTSGATLCLPDGGASPCGRDVLRWLERERITFLHALPSVAEGWLPDLPGDVTLRRLRHLFFAGEPLDETLVRSWRSAFPEAGRIVNLYGPTETTLAKAWYPVPTSVRAGTQPVGLALPQCQILILSGSGGLCGVGETGEIAIRTPFRTRGYVDAPGQQAERFVPNPFRDDADDVLFLTGDRGRYLPDGRAEVVGRIDAKARPAARPARDLEVPAGCRRVRGGRL